MILKDLLCKSCGLEREAMVECDDPSPRLHCIRCKRVTKHVSACTGGCKSRWRYMDWGGVDFTGSVTLGKPEAYHENEDGSETVCKNKNGVPVADLPKFSNDNLNEKHEKVRARHKRAAGKTPIVIDQASKAGG